jgi:hypothetical protein
MAKFLMTDEHVRRRLFWLLQRLSSYSLWQRKREAWALFAESLSYRDVYWRLVWEDTHYCDGIISDESEYFLHEAPGNRIQCRTGDKYPHSGQWATLAGGHQQFTHVRAGGQMPEAKVFKGGYSPQTFTPASWSLLDRDDGGSVFVSSTGEVH